MCNRFGVFMFLLRVRSWSNGHVYNSLHQNQKISEVCFAQNSSGCCKADRAYHPASANQRTPRDVLSKSPGAAEAKRSWSSRKHWRQGRGGRISFSTAGK